MFTGIIQAVGTLAGRELRGGDLRLAIRSNKLPLADVQLGDSIATNGVCLTVIELTGDGYVADVSRETLALSTLSDLAVGSRVNLEKALTLSTPLGGHLVSGHVDGDHPGASRRGTLHPLSGGGPKGAGALYCPQGVDLH